jgi:hypothetical protein
MMRYAFRPPQENVKPLAAKKAKVPKFDATLMVLTFSVPAKVKLQVELPLYTSSDKLITAITGTATKTVNKITTSQVLNSPKFFLDNSASLVATEYFVSFKPAAGQVVTLLGLPKSLQKNVVYPDNNDIFNLYSSGWLGVMSVTGLLQWGTFASLTVTSIRALFFNAINLLTVPTALPSVNKITDMSGLFCNAVKFNSPSITKWNMSGVKDVSYMFSAAVLFNQPLASWQSKTSSTSSFTNLAGMFQKASTFNQPIGNWNVGNVINFFSIFYICEQFNQPLAGWNVSKGTNFRYMFYYAFNFNQDISSWSFSSFLSGEEALSYMMPYANNFDNKNFLALVAKLSTLPIPPTKYPIIFGQYNILNSSNISLANYNAFTTRFIDITYPYNAGVLNTSDSTDGGAYNYFYSNFYDNLQMVNASTEVGIENYIIPFSSTSRVFSYYGNLRDPSHTFTFTFYNSDPADQRQIVTWDIISKQVTVANVTFPAGCTLTIDVKNANNTTVLSRPHIIHLDLIRIAS